MHRFYDALAGLRTCASGIGKVRAACSLWLSLGREIWTGRRKIAAWACVHFPQPSPGRPDAPLSLGRERELGNDSKAQGKAANGHPPRKEKGMEDEKKGKKPKEPREKSRYFTLFACVRDLWAALRC